MRATHKILILTSFLALGFPSLSYGLAGGLDPDFADDGIAVFPIVGTDRALSVALDSGGRIVAGGYSQGVTHNHFAAARLLTDGFLDNSFAGDGRLDLNFVGHDSSEGQAIAVQADGKILGAGSHVMDAATGATDFAIARLNDDGSLDASFNGTGVVTTDMGGSNDIITDMALQADGKILVAGRTTQVGGTDAVVVRYNADGSLDTGFGSGGKAITNLGNSGDFGEDVAVQSDGKIVLAGFSFDGTKDNIALARYLPDGTLDAAFGTGGLVITDTGFRSEAYGVAVQPDGSWSRASPQAGLKATWDWRATSLTGPWM